MQMMGRKGGQEDGWSLLCPAGRKERDRHVCWVIHSLTLSFPGFLPSSPVCTLNPLITKSFLVQCWCLLQNCQTPGWSLCLFCVLPFSKHLQSSMVGVWCCLACLNSGESVIADLRCLEEEPVEKTKTENTQLWSVHHYDTACQGSLMRLICSCSYLYPTICCCNDPISLLRSLKFHLI